MLKFFQISVLFIISFVVSEVALWLSWSNEVGTFSFIFSVLFGYASLLSIIFFCDKVTWLGKTLKFIWNISLSNYTKAFSTSLLMISISILFGFVLYDKWETTKFNVIFEINTKESNIPNDSTMQVENIHTQEKSVGVIEPNGRGRFRINKDSVVQVSAKLGDIRYIFLPVSVEKIPFYKILDLDNAEKLKGEKSESLPQSMVASFSVPQSYFRKFNLVYDHDSHIQNYEKHVKFGLPSKVNLVEKRGYVFSFNSVLRIPNWVAYWITGVGKDIERPRRFIQEPLIDVSLQAVQGDYRSSGYDRGHLVSISDMRYLGKQEVEEANSMATVVPQSRFLNRKTWLELEKLGRMYADNGVGIIAGSIFQGIDNKVQLITIGNNDVGVPTHLFRIIYRIKVDGAIEILSFIVPNSDNLSKDITKYLVSVDTIEKLTGLDFFNELEPNYEEQIEQLVPSALWVSK